MLFRSYSNTTAGVYIGTDGIGLGAGTFYVTSAGALTATSGSIGAWSLTSSYLGSTQSGGSFYITSASDSSAYWIRAHNAASGGGTRTFSVSKTGVLYASSANITGTINATGGTFQNVTITGSIYFNEDEGYYLNPNYNNGSWYIYLPKFRVDDTSAYFSGTLQAPGGNIGGFTIGTSSIYKTKTSYNSSTDGVYIGTDGIGLGKGTFYVTAAGALYATSANITGVITNADDDGWGVKLIENRIEFYQNSTKVSEMYAGSGYYRANMSTTTNGLYISSLLRVGGDLVCGKCLGISTGNGIYVSGKLALTMGQVKVQTNTAVQRYLLFYCGLLVGIGSSKFDGISDYSASTYSG